MSGILTKVTYFNIFTMQESGLKRDWKIEINELISNTQAGADVAPFFGMPVGISLPQPSNDPEATHSGKSAEEVIEKVSMWLEGKSHADVFKTKPD